MKIKSYNSFINENSNLPRVNSYNLSKNDIEEWLKKYKIDGFTVKSDLTVDANWVDLYQKQISEIPFKFNKVKHMLDVAGNELTNLIWCLPTYRGINV